MNFHPEGNRPKLTALDAGAYLKRIYMEVTKPSRQFLKDLHFQHLLHIPFENLDIHYNRPIILDYQKIFKKIILGNRGGFCYELNGLFYHLLSQLGFEVMITSARPFENGKLAPEFDHMIVIVKYERELFLCDVGFGELMRFPKRIVLNEPQLDYTSYFRLVKNPDDEWILQKSKDNHLYESVYQFDLRPRQLIEFLPRCDFHQQSIDSHFRNGKLITQLFPNGRITLTNRELKTNLSGEIEVKKIMNEDEFLYHLQENFGISSTELFQ